jgi:hypothetical protein
LGLSSLSFFFDVYWGFGRVMVLECGIMETKLVL